MASKNEEWEAKLMGKTYVEDDAASTAEQDNNIVRKDMLPAGARVLLPGVPQTRDFRPDRLNVFVDDANVIDRVYFG